MVADVFVRWGGAREHLAPPHTIVVEQLEGGGPSNLAHIFAEDGTHLGDIAYRPHEASKWGGHGLFLC